MVWSHPGVTSWYKNKKGRVVMNSPWRLAVYRQFTADIDLSEYRHRSISREAGRTVEKVADGQ